MPRSFFVVVVLWAGCCRASGSSFAAAPSARPVDFGREVVAVLSKAGCNQGACHGNQNGKGGLKLSLRGQDPADDYRALVRDWAGRRVDRLAPERSLMLLKATNQTAHQGGRRFDVDSPEYVALRDWIVRGARPADQNEPRVTSLEVRPTEAVLEAPLDSARLSVIAVRSDGSREDVTRWATYEPTNLGAEVSADGVVTRRQAGETTVVVRYLDRQVPATFAFVAPRPSDFQSLGESVESTVDPPAFAKFERLGLRPSDRVDDATFLRRAHLDLTGLLPTADEAREFVADDGPDKRVRLVDRLVSRPEFAELWALRWSDLLRVEEKVLDARGVEAFHGWIRDSFALGKPLDEFVRDLLTARGSTYSNAPANYWRALRDPAGRGETTARLFLGVRLQCAQCHNHPFDRWTQDDYFDWTALFARVDYQIVANNRQDKLDQNEFDGEQIVRWTDKGGVKNPRTGVDASARFLGASAPLDASASSPLDSLAAWTTARDNRLFARTQANFIWYHLTGRGLVEPIDDLRPTNPASNPALLDELADSLVAADYDLRRLVRQIVGSRVYATSSAPNATNVDDETNFSRAIVRRLPAEILLDAQSQVLDVPVRFGGRPEGMRAGQLPGVAPGRGRNAKPASGDRFLRVFGKPSRLLGCECERSAETTLAQALTLLGDEDLHVRLTARSGRLQRLAESSLDARALVDELYWTALTRAPTAEELSAAAAAIDGSPDRRTTLEDLAWALLNAKEFLFRH